MKIKNLFSKIKFRPLPSYQLAYLVVILVFFHMLGFQYDNDFWFTINQGRYVLEHSFPTTAIYSIHNLDFLFQSWGSGVVFYTVYNYVGLYGIVSLMIIVSGLTMFFFYKLCFITSNNKRGSLLITIIAYLLYNVFFIVSRPHIFTVLNLVIMLYLLESYVKTNKTKYLYWLPLVTLLEVNMHGIYYIVLLVIASPYLINAFKFKIFGIESKGYRKKPIIIAFILMIITGFINPYGYKTIIYGFTSYGNNSLFNNTVIELLALDFHNIVQRIYIIVIIVTYVLYFTKHKEKPLRYTLLLLGTSYLAFDALKSYYFFVFAGLFPLAILFNKREDIDKSYSKTYHIIHASFTVIACISTFFLLNKPKDPPVKEIIDYLDTVVTNKEEIKLFTDYASGSYAEFMGYYCYLDPRGEIFLKSVNKKVDIYKEYDDVEKNRINYKDFIDKYMFDYMIVDNKESIGYLMKHDSYIYKKVMENKRYTLYELEKKG